MVVEEEAASDCRMWDVRWKTDCDVVNAVTHWTTEKKRKTSLVDIMIVVKDALTIPGVYL